MSKENIDQTTANWMKEAKKGYIRVAVLILLNNKPSHGYEIMNEIKSRTKGFFKPTPGGIYPILTDLEKNKYVTGLWSKQNNRKIKTYRLTEKGKIILKDAIVKQSEIAKNLNSLFQEFARDVLNMKATEMPLYVMPGPFAAFLEEKTEKNIDIKELKSQGHQIKQHIRVLQKKLKIIEKLLGDRMLEK